MQEPLSIPQQDPVQLFKQRLIIGASSWNQNVGNQNNTGLKIHNYIEDNVDALFEVALKDNQKDALNAYAVVWKPIAYFLTEFYESLTKLNNNVYAVITTAGQYLYAKMRDSNLIQYGTEDTIIPANRVVMLRQISFLPDSGNIEPIVTEDPYISKNAPGLKKIRYLEKEACEARALKKKIDRSRKASRNAKAARKANRK